MVDAADRACELEQRQREQALAANKAEINALTEKPNEVTGHRYCLGCDYELKIKRLMANPNAVRCVECQAQHEHEQNQYNHRHWSR